MATTTTRRLLLASLLLAVACCACHPLSTTPSGDGAPVPLLLSADPPDVEIYLDGAYLGELPRWRDGMLPTTPGPHRLELRRSGYFPLRRAIEIGPDGASFKATLRAQPATSDESPATGQPAALVPL